MRADNRPSGRVADAAASAAINFREGTAALAQSKDGLVTDFQNLISEGKSFLRSTAGLSGDTIAQAREQFAATLADAKDRWGELSETAREKGRLAAVAADDYVHAKPWLVIGVVAGVAFVIAALTTRR